MARRMGATFIRGDLSWAVLQRNSATQPYDWTAVDAAVQDANDAGFSYLGILHTVPEWANQGEGVYVPPTDLSEMTRYCYTTAKHYLPRGVQYYEMGNEVNYPHEGWTFNGTNYTNTFLKPCAQGVRQASAELGIAAVVLLGALGPVDPGESNDPVDFLEDVYAAGGAGEFKYLSWHPYSTDPLYSRNMNQYPMDLNLATLAATGQSRQIWATEYGAPTGGMYSVTEQRQAELAEEALSTWFSHPFAGPMFWYSIRDLGDLNSDEREDHFGVLRKDGSAKPVYAEIKRLAGC